MTGALIALGPLDALLGGAVGVLRELPFDWARYMPEALLATLLLAPVCGMVGVFVVNYRLAFFSDAISHSAFTGVAAGLVLVSAGLSWVDPRWTLLALGLVVGVLVTTVKRRTDLGTDTVIGVAFSAAVALGIALVTANREVQRAFPQYLYGDVLLVDLPSLRVAFIVAAALSLYLLWSFNRLTLIGFNADLARTRGTRVGIYDYSFAVLLVLLVTTAIPLTGMLLVTALLVVPAAAARNLARSCAAMFWIAAAIGLVSGVGGLILAYERNTAAGAAIILLATAIFALSLIPRMMRRG
ncbi:MAG: metal ABC transporter permease [Phycisphaerales bacterium]|nr:metal ABC transporter permease [Phycisphaerales bacterium]